MRLFIELSYPIFYLQNIPKNTYFLVNRYTCNQVKNSFFLFFNICLIHFYLSFFFIKNFNLLINPL